MGAKLTGDLTTNSRDTTSMEKAEKQTPYQAPGAQGTCSGKVSPITFGFGNPVGLNFVTFYNQ